MPAHDDFEQVLTESLPCRYFRDGLGEKGVVPTDFEHQEQWVMQSTTLFVTERFSDRMQIASPITRLERESTNV